MGNSDSHVFKECERVKNLEYKNYIKSSNDNFHGIFYSKKINRWVAYINLFYRNNIIGFYATEDEAKLKVIERERKIIGGIENIISDYVGFLKDIDHSDCISSWGNDYYYYYYYFIIYYNEV
jgi:hypothetical protein